MTQIRNLASQSDERIRQLETELDDARRAVIRLMPEKVQEILYSYHRCTSRIEFHHWRSAVIDELVELAKPIPRHSPYDTDRAQCPLCGGSPENFYQPQQGFSLPVGLHRHLEGWGRVHQCDVTAAAFALGREWSHDKFHESEQRERVEAACQLATRKATETLYLTGPNSEPELLAGQYQWRPVRNPGSLSWAEGRLDGLGFKKSVQDRVTSYTQEHSGVVVYADPREDGRLEFLVYRFPTAAAPRKSRREPNFEPRPRFTLMDSWKRDLKEKYSARLAQAVTALSVS
jgi:hypothetical protein